MAEVHIIGELVGASGFPDNTLSCKWKLVADSKSWDLLSGESSAEGQTQVDEPYDGDMCVWDHPIDVHYSCKGVSGWPKMYVEVWHQDIFGRNELYGYGCTYIPSSAGEHELEIVTWRPKGSFSEELTS
eukprot:TRINITY_DN590_c0_g1_i4.p1 TRINITY_DN590_c0_g1~~TRINITY_DN590_c0_g1_i4.p1  ORF type:complete len:149 (+),score=2.22 TRINITY_DN590_c0_g1_i4:61-447(+)